jgi:hypothetical protein
MQIKPNFRKAQINVSSVLTKNYENLLLRRCGENKPNTNEIKANFTYPQSHVLPALNLSKAPAPEAAQHKSGPACDLVQQTSRWDYKGYQETSRRFSSKSPSLAARIRLPKNSRHEVHLLVYSCCKMSGGKRSIDGET